MTSRPRLLVFNQYYWPGVEATAFLLSELCRGLADDFEITVITGKLRYSPNEPTIVHDGVTIIRVPSTTFFRANLALRALNYVTYLLGSLMVGLQRPRPDVVFCMTDPPIIANVAMVIARRFRAPLVVVSQDVFPEIAVELQRLKNPLVVAFLRRAIGFYLRRADRVVAIGETMRKRLEQKGGRADRMVVIPNWVDTHTLVPQPRDNNWAREYGFDDRFVVMHSGNIGHAQNLDALVRAATFLRDLDNLTIALVGDGARRPELIELAEVLEVDDQVRFLPYQDRKVLAYSLSSADIHVVGLAGGLSGYVVPSRLYGILSVGKPVIVAADAESETAQLVAEVGCGLVLPPGRPELLATAIRAAHDGELDLAAMGAKGREYVTQHADRSVAVGRYRTLLREVGAA
ncbi:MAG TPA: glycosyltransferase family 4 protein [Gaiellaceae bacterium]